MACNTSNSELRISTTSAACDAGELVCNDSLMDKHLAVTDADEGKKKFVCMHAHLDGYDVDVHWDGFRMFEAVKEPQIEAMQMDMNMKHGQIYFLSALH